MVGKLVSQIQNDVGSGLVDLMVSGYSNDKLHTSWIALIAAGYLWPAKIPGGRRDPPFCDNLDPDREQILTHKSNGRCMKWINPKSRNFSTHTSRNSYFGNILV